MHNIKNNPWLNSMPRTALFLFIILNSIAMIIYPGSTYRDHLTSGYSFTYNFLSDLGRTTTFAGEINFISSQIFNMSLILSGTIYTLFYFYLRKIFNSMKFKNIAVIGSFFGVLGGLSLIGVGMTPSNLYLDLHIVFANWLFRFMFLASLCYTVVIFSHSTFENKYAAGYLIFTFSIFVYILISELGPNPKESHFALILQVISQKIILLIFLIAVYIQTLGLEKLKKNDFL